MESLAALRQLAYRYALAVDSRNIDDLVGLFVPAVRVGRDQTGRPALHEWFSAHAAQLDDIHPHGGEPHRGLRRC